MKESLPKETLYWLEETWEKVNIKIASECERIKSEIPYIPVEGFYEDMGDKDISWWTNGFWPGILWQMFHATGSEVFRSTAELVEKRLEEALYGFTGIHHDVGFMWLHSSVANYRITGNEHSRDRALHAANILAGRFNLNGKFIRAWNDSLDGSKAGWMIVDCLMNIPLLYWASEVSKDPRFTQIAMAHADTAMNIILREDGSCNHIAAIDPETGELSSYPQGQGFSPESSWSRGQAWAIYGFALSYRHTGEARYLMAAKKAAHYFLANVVDTGYIPLCDFRAPAEPVIYDTSAGTCAACGLLEIASAVSEHEKSLYLNGALRILKATAEKHCNWDTETDSIVGEGCVAYHYKEGIKVPLIYADYFLIEAITRLRGSELSLW